MTKAIAAVLAICFTSMLIAQRRTPIDTVDIFKWPVIADAPPPAISNDGKYAMYSINNIPAGSKSLMVQALDGSWQKAIIGLRNAKFTADNKGIFYLLTSDSLCYLQLGTQKSKIISGVQSFSLFSGSNMEWLAMKMNGQENKLILQNRQGIEKVFSNVEQYDINEDGSIVVIRTTANEDGQIHLRWIDLRKDETHLIWKGKVQPSNLTFDGHGQLAFLGAGDKQTGYTLWLYKAREKVTIELINIESSVLQDMTLAGIEKFTKDGRKIFVKINSKKKLRSPNRVVPLNVWSWTDPKLQSQQLNESGFGEPSFLAVVDVQSSNSLRRLQEENEYEAWKSDDYFLVDHIKGEHTEKYWNKTALCNRYLIKIGTGERVPLPLKGQISPSQKYVVGFHNDDTLEKDLFAYEIPTGVTRNITETIHVPLVGVDEVGQINGKGLWLAGWSESEEMLLYDNFDIWQVDPKDKKPPRNLTNGRGKNLQFRMAQVFYYGDKRIRIDKPVLLSVFNKKTKQSGFCWMKLNGSSSPDILSMDNCLFENVYFGDPVLKARNANVYLVKRESTRESPNLYVTTNFKNFKLVSNVNPEKKVNWMTSELFEFTTTADVVTQAILYKPENFEQDKEYPLLIHYYDKKSDELNKYQRPYSRNGADLDIAWFVSRGYLVCLTDIHYKIGETGESAFQAVVGAARYLSQRPYVDQHHIGLQGHSFGGYETNYIITHSKLFAAAMSSCGISNVTSDYGNIWPGMNSRQEYWELRTGGMGIGVTPWNNPDVYVKNSPIYFVGDVVTPILMMANRNDFNVHFEEGLQLFTSLRRAGKRCWMLEYDNGRHGVYGEEYKDYLLRMTQFFDHYLKGAPAPRWMMYGIPAKDKGYDDGMELVNEKDEKGNWVTPPQGGLLNDEEKKRVEALEKSKQTTATQD